MRTFLRVVVVGSFVVVLTLFNDKLLLRSINVFDNAATAQKSSKKKPPPKARHQPPREKPKNLPEKDPPVNTNKPGGPQKNRNDSSLSS